MAGVTQRLVKFRLIHAANVMCVAYLISIPSKLLNMLQEVSSAHVGGVQAGLMLAGYLWGAGRGLPTYFLICMGHMLSQNLMGIRQAPTCWAVMVSSWQRQSGG